MKTVIIGAGPAGVTVAETLRQHDQQSEIVMLSSEPFPPYSPPAMVEYFATGRAVHLWKGDDFPERLSVDYRQGAEAVEVAPEEQTVRLADGETLSYDKLVIGAGGRLYAAGLEEHKPGVYNFKSLAAAEDLLRRVKSKQAHTALIIGGGFIGVEVALLPRDLGLDVIQVEMTDRVMPRMLDRETSEIALKTMRERGVDVRLNTKATAFLGDPQANAVRLESGETLAADLLVAATGVRPNIEFLAGSGIEVQWGVLVDDHLRTNVPDIYAAGDVAETFDRLTGERCVRAIFPNAVAQARTVAYNLLGWDMAYEGADNMNSLKHLGLPLIAVGQMEGEELRLRRDGLLRKIYLQDNRIVGFRLTGDVSAAGIYCSLVNKQADVSPFKHRLLDRGFGMGLIEESARSGLGLT